VRGIAARAGRWSARHRAAAIGGWIVFVLVAMNLGSNIGNRKLTPAETQSGDSAAATRALEQAGFDRPAGEQVLVQTRRGGTVLSEEGRAAIGAVIRGVGATGRVKDIRSPLAPGNAGQISRDRRSALVLFAMKGPADTASKRVEPVLGAVERAGRAHPALRVEEIGAASAAKALEDTIGKDLSRAEGYSLPLTFGILLVVFGAFVAAIVPLFLAVTAVIAAGGLVAIVSQALPIDDSAATVLLLVGLAVGVDYSLFYLRRSREERAAGRSMRGSIEVAAATSGRSVLVSGLTVIVAMAAMFLTGQGTFIGMAEATVVGVAVAMVGSLTILPAALALLGDRVERGRIPRLGKRLQRRRAAGSGRGLSAGVDAVLSHPRLATALAAGLLVVLALPAFRLQTADLSVSDELPKSLAIMQTYDRVREVFPGGVQPAVVVVTAKDVRAPAVTTQIAALRREALASKLMFDPVSATANASHTAAMVTVPLAGDGTNSTSRKALAKLRTEIVPRTVGLVASAHVAGSTAESVDNNARMRSRTPLVFAFVVLLAFALMLWSFRSVVIAATGVVLNLLSVAAAYGVLVALFQWGWGRSALGLTGTGAIASWLPLFLFVILFGLSMDYHVFTVSRIKEAHDRGAATRDAIHDGIVRSAGVITSAAVIMTFVFLTFATLRQTAMKQLGVGLAAAVLLDATIVRTVLLPATMAWLGERNWRLRPKRPDAPVETPLAGVAAGSRASGRVAA
jgi:RND superfamily putative drug exporter